MDMKVVFLILQITSLVLQIIFAFIGHKRRDIFCSKAGYGYAIWGGIITIVLGAVVKNIS